MSALASLLAEVLARHQPSRWRSFTNDNEILRCCGQDFGNATRKGKRGDDERGWDAWLAHVAAEQAKAVATWIEADEQVEAVAEKIARADGYMTDGEARSCARAALVALARSAGGVA